MPKELIFGVKRRLSRNLNRIRIPYHLFQSRNGGGAFWV